MESNLKFNDGKFTIMSLGDLHERLIIESRNDEHRVNDMHNLVKLSILAFKPDLIVLMGDTCCEYDEDGGKGLYKQALDRILKPVIDSGIPFAYVLGNHEHDAGHEDDIVSVYNEYPTCVVKNDETSPRGNMSCNLLVKDSFGKDDILNLWFIDSNNLSEDKNASVYDWVHKDQIDWYENKAAEIAAAHNGKILPAILFQHIPVSEEYELLREATPLEFPVSVDGHAKWSGTRFVLKDGVDGYLGEGPCAPCINDGQFDSWKKIGDVKAAFFGHDHINDFTGKVDEIILGQNKTSGFRAYTDGCRALVRITTVSEDNSEDIKSKVYHFKDLGLKCTCLGPIEKRITDRQSINMHYISYAAAGVAGVMGFAKIVKKLKK